MNRRSMVRLAVIGAAALLSTAAVAGMRDGGYDGHRRGGYSGGYHAGGYAGGYRAGGYAGGYHAGGYAGGYRAAGYAYGGGYGYGGYAYGGGHAYGGGCGVRVGGCGGRAYVEPEPVDVPAPPVYAPPLVHTVAYPTYPLPTTSSVIYNRPLLYPGWPARSGYGWFGTGSDCRCD